MSPAAAKRTLATGRRLAEQPAVAAAALAGDLSFEQAAAVADGVAADPTKAAELFAQAHHASLPELNDKWPGSKPPSATPNNATKTATPRSLRRWTDRDGAFHAHLYGHPEDGATLWRMLDPIRRRLHLDPPPVRDRQPVPRRLGLRRHHDHGRHRHRHRPPPHPHRPSRTRPVPPTPPDHPHQPTNRPGRPTPGADHRHRRPGRADPDLFTTQPRPTPPTPCRPTPGPVQAAAQADTRRPTRSGRRRA